MVKKMPQSQKIGQNRRFFMTKLSIFENLNLPKMRKNVTKIDWNLEP